MNQFVKDILTTGQQSTAVEIIPQTYRDLAKGCVIRFRMGTAH